MYTVSLVRHARFLLAATTAILLSAAAYGTPTVIDTAVNPANGHVYYLLEASDWTAAENAAVALGGHLATIREALNKAKFSNFSFWLGKLAPKRRKIMSGRWVGGAVLACWRRLAVFFSPFQAALCLIFHAVAARAPIITLARPKSV